MKKIKNGFSMVELLFVMAIMAALAAIAIPSLSAGSDSATLTSMKSDAQNTISTLQSAYVNTQDYTEISDGSSVVDYTDDNDDGFADTDLDSGQHIAISKGNTVSIETGTANEAGEQSNDCFIVTVSNPKIEEKIAFDSCNDGKLQVE